MKWVDEEAETAGGSNVYTPVQFERRIFSDLNVPQTLEGEETTEKAYLIFPELHQLEINMMVLPGQPGATISVHNANELACFLNR